MKHVVHLLAVVGPSAVLLGIAVARDKRRAGVRKATIRAATVDVLDHGEGGIRPQLGFPLAALTTAAAGLVHAAVTRDHFSEYWLLGLFFVACASAQILWAAGALLRPSRWLLKVGLAGNAATLALWIFTRTIGVPVGPDAWTREAVGVLDVAASVFELAAIVAIVFALGRGRRTYLSEDQGLPRAAKRLVGAIGCR